MLKWFLFCSSCFFLFLFFWLFQMSSIKDTEGYAIPKHTRRYNSTIQHNTTIQMLRVDCWLQLHNPFNSTSVECDYLLLELHKPTTAVAAIAIAILLHILLLQPTEPVVAATSYGHTYSTFIMGENSNWRQTMGVNFGSENKFRGQTS